MANASDIRNGMTIKYKNDIWSVIEFQKVLKGRGSAFIRVKLRSLNTGSTIEDSFSSSTKLDDIRVERRKFQYLYSEGEDLIFMDNETYEQINIRSSIIEGVELLKEGEDVEVLFNTEDNSPLTVDLPQYVIRKITYTEPGLKGDTATNTLKPATVEGGAEIRVPLFINIDDVVKIDTATKSYKERVKK